MEYLINILALIATHVIYETESLNPKGGNQFFYHEATPHVVAKQ
jgi:hypothetical protein